MSFQLHMKKLLIDINLADLRDASEFVEVAINEHLHALRAQYEKRVVGLTEDERDYLDDFYGDEATRVGERFAQALRKAQFLVIYASFEDELNSLCEHFATAHRLLEPRLISGKGITRSHTYLKRVASIPFPDDSDEWSRIKLLLQVRNSIAHAGGSLPDQILERVLKLPGVEIGESNRVVLDAPFLPYVVDTLTGFWDRLLPAR